MVDTFLAIRRSLVQSAIQFANAHQGAQWELVSVDEGPALTTLVFETRFHPLRSLGTDAVVRQVAMTIALVEEPDE